MGDTRKVKLSELIEAIRLDGYEQGEGHVFEWNQGGTEILNACAIGQAALNLGVKAEDLNDALLYTTTNGGSKGSHIHAGIVVLNDVNHLTCREIADLLKTKIKYQNRAIEIEKHDYSEVKNYQGVKV